jgi:hypothetical protein
MQYWLEPVKVRVGARQRYAHRSRITISVGRTLAWYGVADSAADWPVRDKVEPVHQRLIRGGPRLRGQYRTYAPLQSEDRAFEGTEETVKRGFLISRGALKPYVH